MIQEAAKAFPQDTAQAKKPVGVNGLRALAASAVSSVERREIWAYCRGVELTLWRAAGAGVRNGPAVEAARRP